ncbi:outer membrane receptor protein involved in Fe transport [Flavobacteriaceae bacterium MAR_2010_72]|nr:outer membrane receptor protein involved in Fe transport [Flavobacteriaceae bacterium MAR_2010_72]TVZ58334.1 outer membrane receptor protein involved in Fe transport [Flavobacteriaceae bacterium MAR_2010_105]
MRFLAFSAFIFLFSNLCIAQNFSVSGHVIDEGQQPIAFANVIVMTQQDSTIVKGVSTDDNGQFKLSNLGSENYIVKISYIGFQDYLKTIELATDLNLGTIVLKEETQNLDEVSIVYQKPTIKKEADRLVFNIENSALTEGNMLQVLKSTPGVLVIDNNISVKNTAPTIYINNRKVNISASELTQLLEGSPANSIKSVEVITNPSAKYDASSGVVLNIVMSKNLVTGYRGNIFANYTQGVFPIYNAGSGHFFKSEKINFYANYSFTDSKTNRDDDERINYLDNNLDIFERWISNTNRNKWTQTHNLNFNFDYSLGDKATLSLSSNLLFLPEFKYKKRNHTDIFDASQDLIYYFDSQNFENDNRHNLAFDLDFTQQLNKGELSFNAHFTDYVFEQNQNVESDYFDSNDSFIQSTAFRAQNNQDTRIGALKGDYSLSINETSVFEAGLKGSTIETNSETNQYDIINGQEVVDNNNTDVFDYNEDVYAAYLNYSKDWDKWNLIAGLRAEQTEVKGVSASNNAANNQSYLEWFPTASISYQPTKKFSIYSNYKRSIERPDYYVLNPFRFYHNDNTLFMGNPNLRPKIVNHSVIGTSFLEYFTVEAYYKNIENNIYVLPRQDNDNNLLTYLPVNFDKTVEYGFDLVVNFFATDRWAVYFVTSFYNIEDQNVFDNSLVSKDLWSNYSVLQNDFSFLEDRSLNLNFTLYYVGKNLQGFRTVEDRWVSSLSISKSLMNKKAVISLSAEDLFNTQDFEDSTRYLNQFSSTRTNLDNRYIKLGFRYNFGNTILNTNARTKNLKERDRLKGGEN